MSEPQEWYDPRVGIWLRAVGGNVEVRRDGTDIWVDLLRDDFGSENARWLYETVVALFADRAHSHEPTPPKRG